MTDSLYRNVALSHTAQLPVLGILTRFASNAPSVLEAVRQTYGAWNALTDGAGLVTPSSARVRIIVHDSDETFRDGPAVQYRLLDAERLLVMAPGTAGVADTKRLDAVVYTTTRVVARSAEFADGLLEPLTLFLLGSQDRQPLHAAAIVRRSVAIVLAGPGGSGKSTLTYAARRAGYTVLADEAVYVQLRPQLRIWGRRSRIHLPIGALEHFPELRGMQPTTLATGKTKVVVSPGEHRQYAEHVAVCLLKPGVGDQPTLERVPSDVVVAELTGHLESGFDLYADTIRSRAAALASGGGWRLTLGGSPLAAVPLLDGVVAELEEGS
ncbi:MAG: hypothetical protein HY337_07945 [Gemmatimonadetes bacterium]|nr:hypothetical protein [Gemmatimonadota bacterium]